MASKSRVGARAAGAAKSGAVRVFEKMAEAPAVAVHGRVFTKPHVVRLILDLAGYVEKHDLRSTRLLDPGCGDGAFIIEAATRLLAQTPLANIESIRDCLLGVENDAAAADECERNLAALLLKHGVPKTKAIGIAAGWIVRGDFLLIEMPGRFDFVVGNPPYVRQEAIPRKLLDQYRARFECFFDRADLYMGFIERGLRLLSDDGVLAYICPNRFMRNQYGKKVRRLIADEYQLRHVIDLAEASPFDHEVLAYPGIYVIGRGKTKAVRFVRLATASESECQGAASFLVGRSAKTKPVVLAHDYESWFEGEAPWITESPEHLAVLDRLEARFPTLGSEASGTTVGIGVASGADSVFLVSETFDQVERDLLVPLAITKDCVNGRVKWSGACIINPFEGDRISTMIDLDKYPKAKRYFNKNRAQLQGRNVAKRAHGSWYRTIDRIYPSLRLRKKLLIPDIKSNNDIVYEDGTLYPHHNLYYVVSEYWNMHALRSILRSSIAKFFVWTYGVKMRSGWLRFQAQYLRRIRIPQVMRLSDRQLTALAALDGEPDMKCIDAVVAEVYGLSRNDLALIQRTVTTRRGDDSE